MNQAGKQCRAIFIDKDGTLIPDIPYNTNTDLVEISDETIEGIKQLRNCGYLLIVISNQSGIAKGYFTEEALMGVWRRISQLLQQHGLSVDGFYHCPHEPTGSVKKFATSCICRKPLPGMIFKAAIDFDINLGKSWVIGDILNDVEAGNRAGCKTVLINNGNETEWKTGRLRKPVSIAGNVQEAADFILQYK